MTPIEIIALVFALFVLIKIGVVVKSPKGWMKGVVKPIYRHNFISMIVITFLAILIFYYLLLELNIVQIYAVIAFTGLLIGIGFLQHPKEIMKLADVMIKKRFAYSMSLLLVIWSILSFWVIFEVLLG